MGKLEQVEFWQPTEEDLKRRAAFAALPFKDQVNTIKDIDQRIKYMCRKLNEWTEHTELEPGSWNAEWRMWESLPQDEKQKIHQELLAECEAIRMLIQNQSVSSKYSITLREKLVLYAEAYFRLLELPEEELDRPVTWRDFKKIFAREIAKGNGNRNLNYIDP